MNARTLPLGPAKTGEPTIRPSQCSYCFDIVGTFSGEPPADWKPMPKTGKLSCPKCREIVRIYEGDLRPPVLTADDKRRREREEMENRVTVDVAIAPTDEQQGEPGPSPEELAQAHADDEEPPF